MGGRAAEEVVFGSITTGAAQDIESATNIARSMITRYGMSEKFGLVALETVESRYLEKRAVMNCAEITAADVDKEIVEIIAECYEEAKKIMLENREILDKIAAYLIEKENITGKEFMEIYCKEKGIPVPEPKNPLNNSKIDSKVDDSTKTEEEKKAGEGEAKSEETSEEKTEDSEVKSEGSEETSEKSEDASAESAEPEKAPEEEKIEEAEEKAEDKENTEEKAEEPEKELSELEKAEKKEIEEMEKAKEELSKEIFDRIQNRAFRFDEDEDKK